MHVSSFDVFDTVLTRVFAEPRDLFLALGTAIRECGLTKLSPMEFAVKREQAELSARRKVEHHEVTLDEIYGQLAVRLGCPADTMTRIKNEELALESRSTRAVPKMLERVNAARAASDRVLFLSDTYLPKDFVESLLRREGFFQFGDVLLVSQAHRASKASGQLFSVARQLLPEVSQWTHLGDHPSADVVVPNRMGIQTEEFAQGRLNRYERLARGRDDETSVWRSKLAGVMRLARLENAETDDHRGIIWQTGCNVVGPLLIGFVHWCLETAQQRGLRRLYFVARDGQILHGIGKILAAHWNYPVECCYLYGSRQAWHPTAVEHFSRDEFRRFFVSTRFLSLQQVFARLGLLAEEFLPQLEKSGLAKLDWKVNLNKESRRLLEECLLDPKIISAVENVSRARRELLMNYLEQQGVLDGTPFALVDIGWFGNLQSSLRRVLQLSGRAEGAKLMGLYFGLITQPVEQNTVGYWNTFASSRDSLQHQNLALFEIFTAADHGSVMGYEIKGDRIEPKLAEEKNGRALAWGLNTLQTAVKRFAELMATNMDRNSFASADFYRLSRRLLDQFYSHPTATEATTWGSFQYSDGQTEAPFEQLVPSWNCRQIISALSSREQRPTYWWHEGTLATRPCLPLSLFLVLRRLKRRLSPL